jgi:hypothetical protein
MPRNARLANADPLDDVSDRPLVITKCLHDAASGGIGQSLEHIDIHVYKYT